MNQTTKVVCQHRPYPPRYGGRPWIKVAPFNVNPRGILIHRIRYGHTHFSNGRRHHDSVTYWCGNQTNGEGVGITADPPADRLLCAICEAKAVAAGEKPADELAGRHVHIGEVRAKRLCCANERN